VSFVAGLIDDPEALAKLYDKGYSQAQIAARAGVSRATVTKRFQKFGIARGQMGQSRPLSPEYDDAETLRRLYVDEGLSTAEIAKRARISKGAITYCLAKYGIRRPDDWTKPEKAPPPAPPPPVQIKPRGALPDKRYLELMHNVNGMGIVELARVNSVGTRTVNQWLAEHGVRRSWPTPWKPRAEREQDNNDSEQEQAA
jgi:transposase